MANDLAYCRACNETFSFADLVQAAEIDAEIDLDHPPGGAWFEATSWGAVIGASHRSVASALGTLAVALFWNGIVSVFVLLAISGTLNVLGVPTPEWFPAPKMDGEPMSRGMVIFLWIFLTPFIVIGLGMIAAFLSFLGGMTEVRIERGQGTVFTGIGPVGWTRRFDVRAIKGVRIEHRSWRDSDGDSRSHTEIHLEQRDGGLIKFGKTLREERRKFVAGALQKLVRTAAQRAR